MSVSWTHILERAGTDLAQDKAAKTQGAGDHGAKRLSSQVTMKPDPIADARSLLARELQATAGSGNQAPPVAPRVAPPAARGKRAHDVSSPASPQGVIAPRKNTKIKRGWGRNLAAVLVSSAVTVATLYAFSQHWQAEATAARGQIRQTSSFSEANAKGLPARGSDAVTPAYPLDEREENVLLYQASELLESGDITGARSIYQNLASQGSQRGAVQIAETYDPNILTQIPAKGLKPDIETARAWYKRATELGSKSAAARIKALESALN